MSWGLGMHPGGSLAPLWPLQAFPRLKPCCSVPPLPCANPRLRPVGGPPAQTRGGTPAAEPLPMETMLRVCICLSRAGPCRSLRSHPRSVSRGCSPSRTQSAASPRAHGRQGRAGSVPAQTDGRPASQRQGGAGREGPAPKGLNPACCHGGARGQRASASGKEQQLQRGRA